MKGIWCCGTTADVEESPSSSDKKITYPSSDIEQIEPKNQNRLVHISTKFSNELEIQTRNFRSVHISNASVVITPINSCEPSPKHM